MNYDALTLADARSFLFVPGDRPERFAKAVAAHPDVVVVDLEDAVADGAKDAARLHLRRWLEGGNAAVVRINAVDTPWHEADLRLVEDLRCPVMLPKAETFEQVDSIASLGLSAGLVIPLVETPRGIEGAQELCSHPVSVRVAFGSIDLAALLGVAPDDRLALLYARERLVMASAAAGCAPPVDGVTSVVGDVEGVADDCRYGKRLGMSAKLCIHPQQVPAVHAALAPTPADLAWAQTVLNCAVSDGGAVLVDGQMVDKPVVARARRLLAAAASMRD